MPEGQCFVGKASSVRGLCLTLALAFAIVLSGCSNRTERAYEEAQRAEAFVRQGDLWSARQAITRALEYRDDQVDLLLLDARIKYLMQDLRQAYEGYRVVLAFDPANPEALQAVALLGLTTGNDQESRDAVEKILAANPGQPDALLVKGVHALNRKDYEEAFAVGETILAHAPDDTRGIVLEARATSLMGETDKALTLLRDTATRIGNNDMIATALLETARDQANAPVMLEQLALLRGDRVDSIDLAIDEANVRYKSGDVAGARSVGVEILARHGDDAAAMDRLGELWLEYDRDPLSPGDRAQLASQGRIEARIAAARHYFRIGDLAVAEALLGPLEDDRVAGLRARIGLAAGEPGAARDASAIVERDTTNCDALATRALSHLRRGDARAAVTDAQVVAAECLDRGDGFLLLAQAYDALEQPAGVERAYSEGVSRHPQDRILSTAYVEWLFEQDRSQAAVSTARRLTQLAPARVSSWRLLARACARASDEVCGETARSGEARAARNFAMDLPPGRRAVNPLLGQSWR